MSLCTTAKALKATLVLDAAPLLGYEPPAGTKPTLTVDVAGRTLRVELNPKSLRKVVAMLAEHGPDGVTVLVQGKLVGDEVLEAGITANPKPAKAEAA